MKLIQHLSVLLVILFLSYPLYCFAEDRDADMEKLLNMSLEELLEVKVTTATKTPMKNLLSPAVVTIITADDIATYGYRSVAEILSHTVSFVATEDLVMSNFGVRGINAGLRAGSRTIKFLLDGQPIAYRATTQDFIGPELIPIDLIERIEIVRGPVSSLYGANAFLGVVNIITRQGSDYQNTGSQLSLSASHLEAAGDGYQVALTGGNKSGKWDYLAGISYEQTDRAGFSLPRLSPAYNALTVHTTSDDTAQPLSLYGKVKWVLDKNNYFQLAAHYQRLNADNAFADLNPLRPTGVSRVSLNNGFMRLDYHHQLSEQIKIHTFMAYAQGEPTSDDRIEVGAKNYWLKRDWGYSSIDFGSELVWSPTQANTLLIGIDYTDDHQDIETFSQVDRATLAQTLLNLPLSKTLVSKGLYAQWQHDLTEHWHSTISYRFDQQSAVKDNQHSVRLSMVGELPKEMVLKLMVGNAFQAPSPELLYRHAAQAGDIIGNPELGVQKAQTAELSLLAPVSKNLYLTGTAFITKVADLVLYQTTSDNYYAKNSTDSTTRGFELEARYQQSDWTAYLNGFLQHTDMADDPHNLFVLNERKRSALFPKYGANFGLSYTWQKPQIKVSLDNRYVGAQPASTQNVIVAQHFYDLPAYWDTTFSISTAAVSLFHGKAANLRFQIRDLFDNQYANPGFAGIDIPSLGRRYLVTYEQHF